MSIIKINKIVASGCSFTFGEELSSPEQEAWPVILANKFDANVMNLGCPGASNEHIANAIIEYCSTNDVTNTLFVIMWSHFSRQTFCRPENHKFLRHISISWPAAYDKDLKDLLFTKYYNENYLFKKTLIQMILLQNFFKANNYPYIMCTAMAHTTPDSIHEDIIPLVNMIDKTKYKGFSEDSFDSLTTPAYRALKGHPDAKAHNEMANIITQWIEDEYQIR